MHYLLLSFKNIPHLWTFKKKKIVLWQILFSLGNVKVTFYLRRACLFRVVLQPGVKGKQAPGSSSLFYSVRWVPLYLWSWRPAPAVASLSTARAVQSLIWLKPPSEAPVVSHQGRERHRGTQLCVMCSLSAHIVTQMKSPPALGDVWLKHRNEATHLFWAMDLCLQWSLFSSPITKKNRHVHIFCLKFQRTPWCADEDLCFEAGFVSLTAAFTFLSAAGSWWVFSGLPGLSPE